MRKASERFGVEELADLAGVSRRAIRYYVQEGLLPAPYGLGRGRHYGREHLDRLIQLRRMQEQGMTLADIRRRHEHPEPAVPPVAPSTSVWRRIHLAPGVELHIGRGRRIPPPARLDELARWCQEWFRSEEDSREQ